MSPLRGPMAIPMDDLDNCNSVVASERRAVMEDSEGGRQMGLRIRPLWDPTGTVSLEIDEERRELVVSAEGERLRFVLREDRPERLGWVEHRLRTAASSAGGSRSGRWSATACASGTPNSR